MKNNLSVCRNAVFALMRENTAAACWTTVTASAFVPVDNSDARYDGLILESEMTTGAPGVATYQNKEVNHMEVLNHPEMWNNFNEIFNRPDPDFFRTNPR